MNEQIDEIFSFLKTKIPIDQRKEFLKSLGFESVDEIKALPDDRKEVVIERLIIERRKRTSIRDIKFVLGVESEVKADRSKNSDIFVPSKTRIEKTLLDD